MGKPSLIAQAALEAEVDRFRLRSIEAKLLKPTVGGGYLRAETTVTLAESSNGADWVSTVGLRLEGYPKEVDQAAPRAEDRTFEIEVVAQCAYRWRKMPSRTVLEHSELARVLGRPMYVLVAAEARAIADKLGIKGVQTPGDIAGPQDEGSVLLAGTQGSEARPVGTAVAAKSRAARPKAKAQSRDRPPTKKKAK